MRKKLITAIIALSLTLCCLVGGTLAWLTVETKQLTNTFTYGDINITLTESPYDAKKNSYGTPAEGVSNAYPMIPGTTYTKDPVVTVTADSESCYLFVMFEELNGAATYLNYTSTLTTANGWTRGDGTKIPSYVWYRTVEKTDTTRSWNLLKDNKITVDANEVTKSTMNTAKDASLKFTAYAVQKANVDNAADAWAIINPTT